MRDPASPTHPTASRPGAWAATALFIAFAGLCAFCLFYSLHLARAPDPDNLQSSRNALRLGAAAEGLGALQDDLARMAAAAQIENREAMGLDRSGWLAPKGLALVRFQDLLDEAPALARELAASAPADENAQRGKALDAAGELIRSGDALIEIERHAAALYKMDRRDEAAALFGGGAFKKEMRAFGEARETLSALAEDSLRNLGLSVRRRTALTALTALSLAGLLGCAALFARREGAWRGACGRCLAALRQSRDDFERRAAEASQTAREEYDALREEAARLARKAEELSRERARLSSVAESLDSALLIFQRRDEDGAFVLSGCNAACEPLAGVPKDRLLGLPLDEAFPHLSGTPFPETLAEVWQTGRARRTAPWLHAQGNGERWFEGFFFRLPTGETAALCADRTKAHRAALALTQSEERHRALYNKTPAMLHSIDSQGRLIGVSDDWLRAMGYERGEVLGRPSTDFLTEESRKLAKERILPEFFRTGVCRDAPYRMVTKSGRLLDVLLSAVAERDEQGGIARSLAVLLDVTDKIKTQEALARSERRFKDLTFNSGDWIWELDAGARFAYVSDSVERILGLKPEELTGKTPFAFMPPDEAARMEALFKERVREKAPIRDLECWHLGSQGRRVCLAISGVPILDRDGALTGFFGLGKDITERKLAESQLKLFEKVFDSAMEGIMITSAKGEILAVNPAFTAITGYPPGEAVGKRPSMLKSDRHEKAFYEGLWRVLLEDGIWEGEIWNRRKSGEAYPEWLSISAIRDEKGLVTHYVGVFHDITEVKRKEEQILHQAYHDPLTDLPNRSLFKDRLGVALSRSARARTKTVALIVDLDNFKTINDSLGHAAGDELLLMVSDRFAALTRSGDTLARLGGDEFGFLLDNVADETNAAALAERIIMSLAEPFLLRGHELFISPSIGAAISPGDGTDPETLMKNADAAMYQAKELGRNRFRLYRAEMNDQASRRLSLESSLRKALTQDELFMVYQPKVDILHGAVTGFEALVRWERGGEIISPMEFIPLAEETGIILPLGRQVLDMTCREAPAFFEAGAEGMRASVNLSPRQFVQPDLVDMIARILETRGVPPERLDLEITETAIAADLDGAVYKLDRLRDMGAQISLDDFGTGYSSLSYLKRFPINTVKIDRSFIMGLGAGKKDETIVRAIIQLAKNFGISVVAEGVETKDQLALLKYFGCDQVQGYYHSPPLRGDAFLAFLRERETAKAHS